MALLNDLYNSTNKKQILIENFEKYSDNLNQFFNNYDLSIFNSIIVFDDIELFNLMINKLGHLKLTEIYNYLNYSFCPNLTTVQEYHDHGYLLLYVLGSMQLTCYHINNFTYTDELKIRCLENTYHRGNTTICSINITFFTLLTDHDFIPTQEIINDVFCILVQCNNYRSLTEIYKKYNISYDILNEALECLPHFNYNNVLKFLLDEGAIANYDLLCKLCRNHNLEMIKYLTIIGYNLSTLAKNPENKIHPVLKVYDLLFENDVNPRDILEMLI